MVTVRDEANHTQKRCFRSRAVYQTLKLWLWRWLYGSEIVLLGVVIMKCEMPTTKRFTKKLPWHAHDQMSSHTTVAYNYK